MRGNGHQPRKTGRKEDPQNAPQNRGVFWKIGGTQVEQHTIEAKRYTVEAILAVEGWIDERLGREPGTQENISANAHGQVSDADENKHGRSDFEQWREKGHWGSSCGLTLRITGARCCCGRPVHAVVRAQCLRLDGQLQW